MKKIHNYLIILCLTIPISIIWMLRLYSHNLNHNKNGFERIFFPNSLIEINSGSLDFAAENILDITDKRICLSENTQRKIVWIDYNLRLLRSTVYEDGNQNDKVACMHMDSPDLYIFHLNNSKVWLLNLNTGAKKEYSVMENFNKGVVISKGTCIIRGVDSSFRDRVFKKIMFSDFPHIEEERGVTPKMNDGGFSTDGMLYFDQGSHTMCYTYFYRNGFICLDTNLRPIRYGKTIDTTRFPQVFGTAVNSEGKNLSFTLLTPPRFVNLKGCVSEGRLFLRSALKADNEDPYEFESNSVLDIYRLGDGDYRGSFYLPAYNGKRANAFQVDRDKLVALYGNRIIIYKLNGRI